MRCWREARRSSPAARRRLAGIRDVARTPSDAAAAGGELGCTPTDTVDTDTGCVTRSWPPRPRLGSLLAIMSFQVHLFSVICYTWLESEHRTGQSSAFLLNLDVFKRRLRNGGTLDPRRNRFPKPCLQTLDVCVHSTDLRSWSALRRFLFLSFLFQW